MKQTISNKDILSVCKALSEVEDVSFSSGEYCWDSCPVCDSRASNKWERNTNHKEDCPKLIAELYIKSIAESDKQVD